MNKDQFWKIYFCTRGQFMARARAGASKQARERAKAGIGGTGRGGVDDTSRHVSMR